MWAHRDTLFISLLGCSGISGNVSRALFSLSFLFSLSGPFSISGFFSAGASETQRWSFIQIFITKIKDMEG